MSSVEVMGALILVLIIVGISIFIIKKNLFAGDANIHALSECKSRSGECKPKCDSTESGFYLYGGCGKDQQQANTYCCVKNSLST
jgi:hypothetical protein